MVWVSMFCCSALSLNIIRSSLIKPTLICHWLQNISQRHSQPGLFWWPHPSCLMSDVVPELHWIWFFWFLLQMIDTSSSSSSAWLMCPLLSATDYYFEGMEPLNLSSAEPSSESLVCRILKSPANIEMLFSCLMKMLLCGYFIKRKVSALDHCSWIMRSYDLESLW